MEVSAGQFVSRRSGAPRVAAALLLTFAAAYAHAGHISAQVDGVEGPLKEAVVAGLEVGR